MSKVVCDRCGRFFEEHTIFNQEEPDDDAQHGVFEGQEWEGVLCPTDG